MHVIAAKAVCFKEAMTKEFKNYQQQIIANAKTMCSRFKERGFMLVSPETDNHLLLVDLTNQEITGKDAEDLLGSVNITVNKNSIHNDPQSPFVTSGIRIGTPAMTTRGFTEPEAIEVTDLMCDAIKNRDNKEELERIKNAVVKMCNNFPVYK